MAGSHCVHAVNFVAKNTPSTAKRYNEAISQPVGWLLLITA